jgi:hypothetical protein
MVIAVVLALAGTIAAFNLPVKQYPDVAPPQISVSASYPGADAETLADALADYNLAIADYALSVMPPTIPADKLAEALVVKP